ncbi:hypothetical protein ALQ72_05600, partial [Pseudomonas syringae pv. maculicola]
RGSDTVNVQMNSQHFVQLQRLHPSTSSLACGEMRLTHNCTKAYVLA